MNSGSHGRAGPRRTTIAVLTLATAAVAGVAWQLHEPSELEPSLRSMAVPLPPPTEHWLDENAESRNKSAREAWIEEMHRAAPDVDWREIERQNGLAEMERRRDPGIAADGDAWTEVGSRNQAGRTMCAMLGPDVSAGRSLYVGSALGGLWRSAPDGSSWTPLGDNLYGGVHEVVVVESFSGDEVLLIRNPAPFVSFDQGATWTTPSGLADMESVRSMTLFEAGGVPTVLVFGSANISGVGRRSALFASTDRCQSFQLRTHWDADWAGSMWATRPGAAGNDVFVAHKGKCYHSGDGGFSFSETGTIDSGATAINLTASEAGSPHVYAATKVGGAWKLYRSRNAGSTFTHVFDLTDYWGPIQASTLNKSLVVYGGVECWRSTDQGNSFAKINGWGEYYGDPANKLHADMMRIQVQPDPDDVNSEIWYVNTDGGTYESRDFLVSVQNLCLSGLGVSQYYSTLTSTRDPKLLHGGTQDQGFQTGVVQIPGDGPSTDFAQIISGDYGHLTSSNGTHDLVYCTYPGFVLIVEGEGAPVLHSEGFPSGASNLWLPPVVAHPTDPDTYFFLGNYLWRANRSGNSWNYTQHSNEDFAAGSANYLSALAFAPTDPFRAYAVNDAGDLYFSTDQGVSWTKSADRGPDNHYFYGNALVVNPNDSMEAFVGGSGYSAVGVRRTRDGGVSWKDMDTGLPSTLVFDLAYSPDGTYVYAAADAGAWRWERGVRVWENIMAPGTPLTTYWSVESVPDRGVIRYGTYGRGIWDYHAEPRDEIWFSVKQDTVLDGIDVDNGDVVGWDEDRGCWSMVLDVGDVITRNVNVDACTVLDDGSILLSFGATETVDNLIGGPNGEEVEDEDLVRFVPSSLGENTAGTFEFYFDGSDLGFTPKQMDVDGVALTDAGDVLLSFRGKWDLGGGFSGKDEDVVAFTPTTLGSDTAGTLAMFFDGSDSSVRLANSGEDIDAFAFEDAAQELFLSTVGDHRVPPGLQGQDNDVLRYTATQFGSDPEGTFTLYLDGEVYISGGDLDAIHVFR